MAQKYVAIFRSGGQIHIDCLSKDELEFFLNGNRLDPIAGWTRGIGGHIDVDEVLIIEGRPIVPRKIPVMRYELETEEE